MSDQALNKFLSSGTAAERAAFTPAPATPASGNAQSYVFQEEDTEHTYVYDAAAGAYKGPVGSLGAQYVKADISPSQITSNQNDYNPASLSTAAVLRLNSDASRNITGLAGGADGRRIHIVNVGSQNIVLKDSDTNSAAGNRFAFDGDLTLTGDAGADMLYDSTSSRWRLLGIGKAVVSGATLSDGDYGDITVSSSGTAMAIDNDAVTYAKMQDVSATQRLLGRNTAGAGNVEEVTAAQLLAWLGARYRLTSITTTTGTPAATTETDLLDYTLSAGALATNGQGVRVTGGGSLAATTRSRTVRLYFGTTVIATVATTNASNIVWSVEATVLRVDATNQRVQAIITLGTSNSTSAILTVSSPTETLSGALSMKITGQVGGSPVANDIVGNFYVAEFLP